MKVGYTLICKNVDRNIGGYALTTPRKTYDVLRISNERVVIQSDHHGLNIDYVLHNKDKMVGDVYIWDIFYNETELRKKKLESI
ncbi:hypothetical protein M0Q50_05340 [bacterium]|jgi:hypothetical protein|nr:hypothetical protein [bacterium]